MTWSHGSSAGLLPRLLVLTDAAMLPAGRDLVSTLRAAVEGGARAVVLRERDLPSPDSPTRSQLRSRAVLGRSTHSVAEVFHPAAEACNYATLSVASTRSKHGCGPGPHVQPSRRSS
jgi:thiamine monophosphate synthase